MIIYSIFEMPPMFSEDVIVPQIYVWIVPSVTEAALSKLAAIFNFILILQVRIQPRTASDIPTQKSKKGGEQGCFARDKLEGRVAEKIKSCLGDHQHVSEKGVGTLGEAMSPYLSHC